MLTALAALEIAALRPRFRNAAASAGYLLALAAPLAVVTAGCGWLLSLGGGYDATLLAWHKWLGTCTAVAAVVAALCYRGGKMAAYRASLFVAVSLLLVAGHLGGSLTHGSDYFTRYAPEPFKKLLGLPPVNAAAAPVAMTDRLPLPVFAVIIEPVFANKCVICHGPAKAKGGLRLDSFAAVMQGGKDDVAIVPGHAAQSPLVQRALLPAGEDDHMPPDGKPQLTRAELTILQWWIDAGAPETNTLGELRPPSEVLAALSGH